MGREKFFGPHNATNYIPQKEKFHEKKIYVGFQIFLKKVSIEINWEVKNSLEELEWFLHEKTNFRKYIFQIMLNFLP